MSPSRGVDSYALTCVGHIDRLVSSLDTCSVVAIDDHDSELLGDAHAREAPSTRFHHELLRRVVPAHFDERIFAALISPALSGILIERVLTIETGINTKLDWSVGLLRDI